MLLHDCNRRMTTLGACLAFLCALAVGASAAKDTEKASKGEAYPLSTCPVTGMKLGSMGDPIIHDYEGREVRFCCAGCVPKFDKEPEKYLKKADAEIVEMQKPYYPLDTCPISGGKLGEMGKPIEYIHQNRLVRFCCVGCIEAFEKDPTATLSKLDKAVIEKQKPTYALKTCPVSGDKLTAMGKPVDLVYGNRLVQLCCNACVKTFKKDPPKYMSKLDAAPGKKPAAKPASEGSMTMMPEGSH